MSLTRTIVLCVAEIEAKEACDWLRAAGFPQYAQLFEGNASPQTQASKTSQTPSHPTVKPQLKLF